MSNELNLSLHKKQSLCFNSEATEILYGGAAGGGKSHLMRTAAIYWCSVIPGLQVYLFRRIREDLVKNHVEGPKGFRSMLADWVLSGFVDIVEDEIRFWNGAKIYLCHCKDEKDRFKYQGAEIHVLLIDEVTHFTEVIYRFLRNRVRMIGVNLNDDLKGRFPRVLVSGNPGGIGHLFVKETFIDKAKPLEIYETEDEEGGMLRQYIPAQLEDNPSMTKDDPGYEKRLLGLGSHELVQAMRHGNWDVVEGAYFAEWSHWCKLGIIEPFTLPDNVVRFRSFDWGSAKPFSVGWWAIHNEDIVTPLGQVIPKGSMIRYREWYGAQSANKGLKMTVEAVAAGIKEREAGENIKYGVADPAIFTQDGGPSMAERMLKVGVSWRRADNKRVASAGHIGGWDQLRSRFIGHDDMPMIYSFSTNHDSHRTIPSLQHDDIRPEDLDSDGEDHAADEWRYAAMSRPYAPPAQGAPKPEHRGMTFNEMRDSVTKKRLANE